MKAIRHQHETVSGDDKILMGDDMEQPVSKEAGKTGMLAFTIVWIGQMLSLFGTNMTGFAVLLWAYHVTKAATPLTLLAFFGFLPIVAISPIAGAIVDRYDRKKIMILADFAAGLPTIAVLILYVTGVLGVWHLFITGMVAAAFQAFHFPAYSAAITMMLRKEQLGRANGMLAIAQFAAVIFSPIAATLIMSLAGFADGLMIVLLIDIATFLLAISMLFFVHVPRPPATEAGRRGMGSIWTESLYGFRYIYQRPSLLGLQLTFFAINMVGTFGNVLVGPMILARLGEDYGRIILGSVMAAMGAGGLVGSILLTIWGGPKRRVHGVLFGMVGVSLFGMLIYGLGKDVYTWASAAFLGMLFMPIINGSNQAIWQAKVAPDVQGRVFATRLLIAQISVPLAMVIAGPLADFIFEPAMIPGSTFSNTFGWLVGTGTGTGMSLMFVITGILGIMIGLGAYAIRDIRKAEDILPDHGAEKAPSPQTQA